MFFYMLALIYLHTSIRVCNGYRILVVFHTPVPSHTILGYGIVKHLLDAGHQVTYITPIPSVRVHDNLTQIDVSLETKIYPKKLKLVNFFNYTMTDIHKISFQKSIEMSELIMLSDKVQRLMYDPHKTFDVIILEWTFTKTYMGLATVFDCPIIWFIPLEPYELLLKLMNSREKPSFLNQFVALHMPGLHKFFNQLYNFYKIMIASVGLAKKEHSYKYFLPYYLNITKEESKTYGDVYKPILEKTGRTLPSYYDIYINYSLVLSSFYEKLNRDSEFPTTLKFVGGLHIDAVDEIVPEYLQEIMDNAQDGLIYFSMGTNIDFSYLPKDILTSLLSTFKGLKQTVIWKFEGDLKLEIPNNVHILPWAPQQSILGHPNCMLFITHGGLLSILEAVYFGVPVIGIPVYGDQANNVIIAIQEGYGLRVLPTYEFAKPLEKAIHLMLVNPLYRKNAKRLSKILRTHSRSPGEELVKWVKAVATKRGPPDPPELMRPWYQYLYDNTDIVILIASSIHLLRRFIKLMRKFSIEHFVCSKLVFVDILCVEFIYRFFIN